MTGVGLDRIFPVATMYFVLRQRLSRLGFYFRDRGFYVATGFWTSRMSYVATERFGSQQSWLRQKILLHATELVCASKVHNDRALGACATQRVCDRGVLS